MEDCLLLSARPYSFKDEQGNQREGVTLHYVTGTPERTATRLGLEPLTVSVGAELRHELAQVPGFYRFDFRQRPGQKGRPVLQVVGLHFVAGVNFQAVPNGSKPQA